MNPIWKDLPLELSEHVCNQLPKVRRIPENLKTQITSQRWMLAKCYSWYLEMCMYSTHMAYSLFQNELGCHGDINQYWMDMSPDDRLLFYYHGPGSREAKLLLEGQNEYREWRETMWDS